MYYQKFINFLKKHNLYDENIINYWKENKICFDYKDEEKRDMIGCLYLYKKNILYKIRLIVPFIESDKTILINIHEYIHLFQLYKKIGKRNKLGMDKEVLPIYYERVFIQENETKELLNYYEYINQFILKSNQEEYIIALKISDILLNQYQEKNITKLETTAKKLTKKLMKLQ